MKRYHVIERSRRLADNGKAGSQVVWASEPFDDVEAAYALAQERNSRVENPALQILRVNPLSILWKFEVQWVLVEPPAEPVEVFYDL